MGFGIRRRSWENLPRMAGGLDFERGLVMGGSLRGWLVAASGSLFRRRRWGELCMFV